MRVFSTQVINFNSIASSIDNFSQIKVDVPKEIGECIIKTYIKRDLFLTLDTLQLESSLSLLSQSCQELDNALQNHTLLNKSMAGLDDVADIINLAIRTLISIINSPIVNEPTNNIEKINIQNMQKEIGRYLQLLDSDYDEFRTAEIVSFLPNSWRDIIKGCWMFMGLTSKILLVMKILDVWNRYVSFVPTQKKILKNF